MGGTNLSVVVSEAAWEGRLRWGQSEQASEGAEPERESTCEVGLCDTYRRWIRFLLDPLLPANAQSLTPTCYPQFLAAEEKAKLEPQFLLGFAPRLTIGATITRGFKGID